MAGFLDQNKYLHYIFIFNVVINAYFCTFSKSIRKKLLNNWKVISYRRLLGCTFLHLR